MGKKSLGFEEGYREEMGAVMEEVGETLLDEENTKEDKTVEAALSWAKTSRRSC